jgi:hypothetical protein
MPAFCSRVGRELFQSETILAFLKQAHLANLFVERTTMQKTAKTRCQIIIQKKVLDAAKA